MRLHRTCSSCSQICSMPLVPGGLVGKEHARTVVKCGDLFVRGCVLLLSFGGHAAWQSRASSVCTHPAAWQGLIEKVGSIAGHP
jgi:hypothetical protein